MDRTSAKQVMVRTSAKQATKRRNQSQQDNSLREYQ
jgi:hypothetical protein